MSAFPTKEGQIMAVDDDLRRLADLDVVYLSRMFFGSGEWPVEWYRGRLRQALNGEWVFNAYAARNGVIGFELGSDTSTWTSSESPASGLNVQAGFVAPAGNVANPLPFQMIVLASVIPDAFAD